jgi:hypothetical protein
MNPWNDRLEENPEDLREWQKTQIIVQENCPNCGNKLTSVFSTIGSFSGHEHVHPGSLWGYDCSACHSRFSLKELADEKAKKEQKEKST